MSNPCSTWKQLLPAVLLSLVLCATSMTLQAADGAPPLLPAPGDPPLATPPTPTPDGTPPADGSVSAAPVVPTRVSTTAPSTAPTTGPVEAVVPTTGPVFDPEDAAAPGALGSGIIPSGIVSKARSYMSSRKLARATPGPDAMLTPSVDPLPSAKPLPKDFSLLKQRSIFSKTPIVISGPPRPPSTTEVAVRPNTVTRAEGSLVFTGVGNDDGMYTALVEDTVAAKIIKVHIGDPIANGMVAAMTLSTLEYNVKGAVTTVRIGQNLDGGAGIIPATRPSIAAGTPSTPGGPPGASGATGAAPGSAADIIEKLRRKRAAELGGK